ncbi:hypothetical protein [Bacillus sp. 3255]|uniref:hypothetical protein n=1 Tax=Bacillus sp. 3255 TaxID=2817904 RepID=UPI00286A70DC|nr:hypothetical protein [Bacillus sp. 3255]
MHKNQSFQFFDKIKNAQDLMVLRARYAAGRPTRKALAHPGFFTGVLTPFVMMKLIQHDSFHEAQSPLTLEYNDYNGSHQPMQD